MFRKSISQLIDQYKILLPTNKRSDFWYPPDTKELFRNNLEQLPKDWHYRTQEVRYDLNCLGYRTKELKDIDWENSMVIFGDSMVFGIGVSEEETISAQVERLTGIPTINLGVSGSSPILTLHNSMLLIQSFPSPKYVVSMWSTPTRFLCYGCNEIRNLGTWSYKKHKDFIKGWNEDPYNIVTHLKFNVKIMKELWKNKSQYYEFTFFEDTALTLGCDYIDQVDDGRDIRKGSIKGSYAAHPGRKTYEIAANKIIKAFNLQKLN
jgi:hypothetical protein